MLRKKILTAVLAVAIFLSVPFMTAAKENNLNSKGETKIEVNEILGVLWTDEMIIDPETSKKVSPSFESEFALKYAAYNKEEISVIFYSDSRKVIFDDVDNALPESIRTKYEAWASSKEYAAWIAKKGKDEIGHIAANIERVYQPVQEVCQIMNGCYSNYYIVNYYHYESEKSQKPFAVYQKHAQYNECCGSFKTDYLNKADADKVNSDNGGIAETKELKDYTEAEIYQYMRNYLEDTISNDFVSDYVRKLAKDDLSELDNKTMFYIVDGDNHLTIFRLTPVMRESAMIKWLMERFTIGAEKLGKTIASSNFESLTKIYSK